MHDDDPAPISPPTPTPANAPQRLAIEFTGSGSEYFRIWLVNLLLTVVTLSLYLPFARARRLAYFHGNTIVGGQPLGFHGDPRKMLRGHLLILLFGVVYGASTRFSPLTAVLAVVAFAALWPALWRASMQFRLGNTSWRGLRFGFDGSFGGAYFALLPAAVPWLAIVSAGLLAPRPGADGDPPAAPDPRLIAAVSFAVLLGFALVPLALAWIKRYQHGHYTYARQRSRLEAGGAAFYRYALKLIGVSMLASTLGGVALGGLVEAAGGTFGPIAIVGLVAFYAAFFVVMLPFSQSRLQNLVWGHTRSQELRVHSLLTLQPLAWLTLKNLVLTIVTLGLYRPFAAVATARMRLQAVSVDVEGDIAHWTAGAAADAQDATGDAAGDFFGIDVGL